MTTMNPEAPPRARYYTATAEVHGASAWRAEGILDVVPGSCHEGPLEDGSERITFDVRLGGTTSHEQHAWGKAMDALVDLDINLSDVTLHLEPATDGEG